jgi:hypothetical protein
LMPHSVCALWTQKYARSLLSWLPFGKYFANLCFLRLHFRIERKIDGKCFNNLRKNRSK